MPLVAFQCNFRRIQIIRSDVFPLPFDFLSLIHYIQCFGKISLPPNYILEFSLSTTSIKIYLKVQS